VLSILAATHGDPGDALDDLILCIRYYYDSGNFYLLKSPLSILVLLFDKLGHHEAAATMSGFATTPFTLASLPEINTAITHLREVLGDATYESIARSGEHMTSAAVATYALDQIELARAEIAFRAEKCE
jgi:hypothetical protein